MDLIKLNIQLKKYFPQEKIVFGGSFVTGQPNRFSDFDIYIIFNGLYEFYQTTRDKNKLKKIKIELAGDKKISLHLMPSFLLSLGLYRVEGVFFINHRQKKFFNPGDEELWKLNCLKLALKHLILYKLREEWDELAEKHFLALQKNFRFLTNRDEDDLEQMENDLELQIKKVKKFIFKDWLFYCLRFKRIMPRSFEQRIINCLLNLKRFVNTGSDDYVDEFYRNFKHLAGGVKITKDAKKMFELIDRYIFLIFII